jgi:hypothetical protein
MTLAVATTIVVGGARFDSSGSPEPKSDIAGAAPTGKCAGADWGSPATGQKFRDNKRLADQRRSLSGIRGDKLEMANRGDFAYGSLPVEVAAPGTYSFQFGPVPDSFRPGKSPAGLAFAFPPDFSADMVVIGEPAPGIVMKGEERYFQQSFVVNSVKTPCSAVVAWIY